MMSAHFRTVPVTNLGKAERVGIEFRDRKPPELDLFGKPITKPLTGTGRQPTLWAPLVTPRLDLKKG